jgi:hypothetical protein
VIEELAARSTDSIEDVQQKFYGVVVGKVINPLDPMTLGRVQVQLPFVDSLDLSPWARVAMPMAGILHGFYFIPNVGDEVLVAFEHGDINAPYIIGSLWNALAPPPLPSPLPQIRAIRTLAGNQIVMSEAPPTITIQSGPTSPVPIPMPPTPAGPPTVIMSPAGIQIMSGRNLINMTEAGIQIVAGTNAINMTPDGITITAAANLTLAAGGMVSIAGATVSIKGGLVTIN